MKKILLIGNPNVGKSALFNRLTGVHVIVSNYPGTTVEYTRARMKLGDDEAEIFDVPGVYSLRPESRADEAAIEMLREAGPGDVIVNVIDSTNLERSLNLTLQVLKLGKPVVVALNLWDEAGHTGIRINHLALRSILGVPCIPLTAITGDGVKDLVGALKEPGVSTLAFDEAERWNEIGRIVSRVQHVTHRHHTFLEALGDASLRPLTGIPIAAGVLLASFEAIRLVGETLITWVFDPFFRSVWWPHVIRPVSDLLGGSGFLHEILVGKLVDGAPDFERSLGILTTGLSVPFGTILPYVLAYYATLSFLEDSGYLPRLAVLADGVMHRLGMHGMGIIPMLLGLGCKVPGALSARTMESPRERFIALTLMGICIPCMAQTAMIIGLAGSHGARALAPIFLTLLAVWVGLGTILNRLIGGESPEMFMDIPPYRVPYLRSLAKKVWMRIYWYMREAVPWVLAGVLGINLLFSTGAIGWIAREAGPTLQAVLGLPPEAAVALIVGLLRKYIAVGMLLPLELDLRQIIVSSVLLGMFFPCVATFAVMLKELGTRGMAKSTAIMVATALVTGITLNILLKAAGI